MCALRRKKNQAKLFVCLFIPQTPRVFFVQNTGEAEKTCDVKGQLNLCSN